MQSPLKLFQRVGGNGPTLEEMDLLFAESENRRWSTFDESRDKQATEFTDAEVLQWEGEKTRYVRFDKTMTNFEDEFATSQADKDTVFRNSEARHDGISRTSEVERNGIFRRREANHEKAFRQGQDAMEKQSEWYYNLRVQLLQEGRGIRGDGGKKLEKAMCDEFETTLRLQQDAFLDAEHLRDKLVDDAISQTNSMQNDVNGSLNHDPALNSQEVPADGLDDSVQQMNKERSSTPPQAPVVIDMVADSSDQSCPPSPSSFDSRKSSRSADTPTDQPQVISRQVIAQQFPQDIPHPIGIPADDGAESLNEAIPQAAPAPDIQKQFSEGQRRREEIFKQDEMDREARFNEAESDRDGGEDNRRAIFAELHEMEFKEASVQREEYFELMEHGRTEGERRRNQQFNDARGRRSSVFETSQSWSRRRYKAMDENETFLSNILRNGLKELDDAQRKCFDEAKQQQSSAFNNSQADRGDKLRWVHNMPDSSGGWSMPSMAPMPIANLPEPPSKTTSHSFWPAEGPMSAPRHRALRDINFEPGTLLVPPHISTPLPIPGDNMRKKETATSFHAAERRRQFIFEKSQADRKKKFEESARTRQQVFSVNEAKRQQEFEKQQRNQKKIFSDDGFRRAKEFADSQLARERTFRGNEEARETTFIAAEEQRTNDFTKAQATRDNEFHELHETLQRQCVESESLRRSEFVRWERGMRGAMQRRSRQWKERFNTEERERNERFLTVFHHVFPEHAANQRSRK